MIIYKYVIDNPSHDYKLTVPLGSLILCVQNQNEKVCVWVNVSDPITKNKEVKTLKFIMTGDVYEYNSAATLYLDTIQLAKGALVIHVFEEM